MPELTKEELKQATVILLKETRDLMTHLKDSKDFQDFVKTSKAQKQAEKIAPGSDIDE